MYWRMYAGHNCTNYAAYRMVNSGLPNARPWSGGGNATYWGTSVPSLTDKVPTVGAVAWWKANTGPAGSAGHVAYVEQVVSADRDRHLAGQLGRRLLLGGRHQGERQLAERLHPLQRPQARQQGGPDRLRASPRSAPSLTATAGAWNPTDAKVAYQWFANGVAIPSATKSTLTLSAGPPRPERSGSGPPRASPATPTKTATSATTAAVLPGSSPAPRPRPSAAS